ncbi:hypothetical protein VTG60DRAFT_4354 [Thermothelomyces hinnuleus]
MQWRDTWAEVTVQLAVSTTAGEVFRDGGTVTPGMGGCFNTHATRHRHQRERTDWSLDPAISTRLARLSSERLELQCARVGQITEPTCVMVFSSFDCPSAHPLPVCHAQFNPNCPVPPRWDGGRTRSSRLLRCIYTQYTNARNVCCMYCPDT